MGVRREKVIVDLEDRASRPLAFMAASADTYAKRLDATNKKTADFDRSNTDLAKSIDYMAVRVSTLSHLVTTFGTALIPMATAAAPAVAGLANQMGFAAIAGGTAIVAFQGVGDALKALNEAQLDPSEANLEKLREEMAKLGPAGRDFVRELQSLRPQLQGLQDTAQAGLFPGLTDSIDTLMTRFPVIDRIIAEVSDTMGDLAAEGAEAIAGPGWDDWFAMIEREARPALEDMGRTVGNLAKGLAELWMAFMPLSKDFSGGFLEMSRSFADWAANLSSTEGFAAFVDYVRTTVPDVLDTLGSLAMALVDLGTAFAPVGDVALKALTAIAEAISAIASSSIGPTLAAMFAGMRAFSLASTIAARSSQAFATSQMGMVSALDRQKSAYSGIKSELTGYAAAQKQVRVAQSEANRAAGAYNGVLQLQNRTLAEGGKVSARAQAGVADALGRVQMANYGVAQATERANEAKKVQQARLKELGATAGRTSALVGGLAIASTGAGDSLGLTNTASLALMGTMAGPWGSAIGGAVGFMIDAKDAANDLSGSVQAMNLAFESGDIEAMAAARLATLKQLAAQQEALANPFDLGKSGDRFAALMGKLSGNTNDAKEALSRYRYESTKAKLAAQDVAAYQRQANALRQSKTAAQETAKSFLDISSFASDAELSLDGFIRKLNAQATALVEFGQNANKAMSRGVAKGLVEQLRALGPAGAERLKQLADATDSQIGRANRAFQRGAQATRAYQRSLGLLPDEVVTQIQQQGANFSRDQIVDLTRRYKLTPKQVRTLITQTGAQATRAEINSVIREAQEYDRQKPNARLSAQNFATPIINAASAAARSFERTYTATLVTNRITNFAQNVIPFGGGSADGGTVSGQRAPYGDKVLMFLAPGEEVISNRYGQADRNRELLKRINDNRMADGGTVRAAGMSRTAPRSASAPLYARIIVDAGDLGVIVDETVAAHVGGENELSGMLERAGQF